LLAGAISIPEIMPLGLSYQFFFLMICNLLLILVPAWCLVLESRLIRTNDAAKYSILQYGFQHARGILVGNNMVLN